MDTDSNTTMATCATMVPPNDEVIEQNLLMHQSRLTFRSKFEHILDQLSKFVNNYQQELQQIRSADEQIVQRSKINKLINDKPAKQNEDVAKSLVEVNETLANIEEDLHKILSLMMLQVDLMLQQKPTLRSMNYISKNDNNINVEDSLIEFHDFCHEEELKFNGQLAKLKLEMDKYKGKATSITPRRHYQLRSNDVHFILGTVKIYSCCCKLF